MKTHILSLAVVGIAALATPELRAAASERAIPVIADRLTPVAMGQVKLSGLLGKHVESVPRRLVQGQREAYLQPFEAPVDTNSWRAEHIGKWLEAACNYQAYTHDDKLRAQIQDVVNRLSKAQQPDGWLGSYAPEYRFHKYDWKKNVDKKYVPFYDGPFYDVWCHYMTMVGLMRCYEVRGDRQALEITRRMADLLAATFGDGRQDLMLINHDHGFGPGVGVFPMSKLYLLTGEARYRDFARYVVSQYGRPGKVPILVKRDSDSAYPFPEWAQIKHCECELCLAGMCQLYRATGEEDLFDTCRNIYRGYHAPQVETLCLHGFKSPPPGVQVPDTYYALLETCDIVPMLRWFVEMARITGDPQYLDALEWNLYNSFLSRDLPDGRTWPGVDVPNGDFFHCCYSMLTVGLSCIPEWVYFTTPNGLLVNLYEPSTVSARVSGVGATITQTTQYPLDGVIDLSLELNKPASFDLWLRIPRWCLAAQVTVNGKPLAGAAPCPGTLLKISRRWKTANTVRLALEMPGRSVRREFAGTPSKAVFTVQRGPLLLAMTAKLNAGVDLQKTCPAVAPDHTVRLDATGELRALNASSTSFRAKGITSASASGNAGSGTDSIILVPYAFSGVSDKPAPPAKTGVFNPYSEDGVGSQVRVEFAPAAER